MVCKDCERRHRGCHSTCAEYQEFVKRREKIRQSRREVNEWHDYYTLNKRRYLKRWRNQ